MALFGMKKEKTEAKKAARLPKASPVSKKDAKEVVSKVVGTEKNFSGILKHPRVTEKATDLTAENVYTFDVDPRATKQHIKIALKQVYNVVPVKINVAQVPSKKVRMRTKNIFGKKAGGKKAYVYLKKGETIDTV